MGMSRRKFNECLCPWCGGSTPGRKRWVKNHTIRLDRVEAKEQIAEQMDDWMFGVDPD